MRKTIAYLFWFNLALVFCCVPLMHAKEQSKNRPNILWISLEDVSAHFGCYGDPQAITPNVDALAELLLPRP